MTDIQYQAASCFGLWYPEKRPGDLFSVGDLLGVTRDYEGNILEESVAQENGVIPLPDGKSAGLRERSHDRLRKD